MKLETQNGYALIVVMFAIAAITSFLAMLTFSASQQAFTVRRLSDNIKAKALAESGCEYAYAVLSANWEARNDPNTFASIDAQSQSYMGSAANMNSPSFASTETSSGGAYQISVQPIGTTAALVTTSGRFGDATSEAMVGIMNYGGNSDDGAILDPIPFEYAILCGGNLLFRGCGTISSADGSDIKMHSNNEMNVAGDAKANITLSASTKVMLKKVHVGGSIIAPQFELHKQATWDGSKIQKKVPRIAIPDIDLTPYYNWAKTNGEVKNGSFSITSDYTPKGGILWVNGDFSISSHATLHGSVISTTNVKLSGQANISPTTCAFGVVSRNGSIDNTSSGTIKGLIYAKSGNYKQTANGRVEGQLIIAGEIQKGGNSDIIVFKKSVPLDPSSTGGPQAIDLIGIAAWLK
jgi:hypothetical protein